LNGLMGRKLVRPLKSLGQGFLVATGLIWAFNIASLFRGGDAWLAFLYLLVLLIPVVGFSFLKFKSSNSKVESDGSAKWRNLLFSFQGVVLAFWMFDITTTFYAINVTGLAVELNPLGWPLGILGAFAYYAPTLVFAYILLFKMKDRIAFFAAVPLTLITLSMGMMNLLAAAQNFQVFVNTVSLATGIRYVMLGIVGAANLVVPLALKRLIPKPLSHVQPKIR
jgi:hypothetical protein